MLIPFMLLRGDHITISILNNYCFEPTVVFQHLNNRNQSAFFSTLLDLQEASLVNYTR